MGKGSKRERELCSIYQSAGYATYRPATVQYGENDIFGLFDVLAVSPDDSRLDAIQVKSNAARGINKWHKQTWLWRRLGWRTLYAVPYDYAGWRLIRCGNGDARVDCVDERDMDCSMGDGLQQYLEGRV